MSEREAQRPQAEEKLQEGTHHSSGGGSSSHHHHHHHHHRHHRRGPFARLRRRMKKHKKEVALVAGLVVLVLLFFGYFAYRNMSSQKSLHVESGNSYDMGAGYRNVVYNGRKYEYNQLITTVLYVGVDSLGEMQTFSRIGMAPLSDSVSLVVFDKKRQKMSIISINRDTICRIRRYSLMMDYWEYYESQLAYAYAFGDGAEISINNVVETVSNLLGVPIDDYVITNRDSIAGLNDLVGGVDVVVPNDDLVSRYPEMKTGNTVHLNADNVASFVRYRDTSVDFSNATRLERQKAFINSYVDKLQDMLPGKAEEFWDQMSGIEHFMQTSITRNKYLKYAKLVSALDYGEGDFIQLPGEYVQGKQHHEFYVDVDEMRATIMDLFYELA